MRDSINPSSISLMRRSPVCAWVIAVFANRSASSYCFSSISVSTLVMYATNGNPVSGCCRANVRARSVKPKGHLRIAGEKQPVRDGAEIAEFAADVAHCPRELQRLLHGLRRFTGVPLTERHHPQL